MSLVQMCGRRAGRVANIPHGGLDTLGHVAPTLRRPSVLLGYPQKWWTASRNFFVSSQHGGPALPMCFAAITLTPLYLSQRFGRFGGEDVV